MLFNVSKLAAVAALVTGLFLAPGTAVAVPATGACCSLQSGCCDAPVELDAGDPRGVEGGTCRMATQQNCNGINDDYQGDGTTCEQFCPIATTTTTLPTGACCHAFNGCCGAPVELQDAGVEGGVGGGECRISTSGGCNGIVDSYQGDGTTCEELCPILTTTTSITTTTTLPTGACCEPLGTCLEVTEQNCVIGVYQGDATTCATVECTQPTTTTVPETTTTTDNPPTTTTVPDTTTTTEQVVVLCGDANGDGEVTSVDALIALRTSVGIAACPETRCDYNGSGEVQSSDALAILRVSVGQLVVPMCPVL